jgi:hypothetical protein
MRKRRKTIAVDQDGNLVTIPRLPASPEPTSHPTGTGGVQRKRSSISSASASTACRNLSWHADDLDPYRLAAQTQVIRVVAMLAAKLGDEARRERQRAHTVERLIRKLPPEHGFREKP